MSPRQWPSVTAVSPVAAEIVACRHGGVLWATVVVKATFQLVPGQDARRVAPVPLVREDEPRAQGGSLVRARETAPHLPSTGVVLTGHAWAKGGGVAPSMSVRLGIAREKALLDKTLHVFGPRLLGASSLVEPFRKMPLIYENAAGGPGVWTNPVGIGGPDVRALPCVVDPRDPRRPAGFGPISAAWMPRRGYLGETESTALSEPVFEVAPGFDWRYFQAAPADQLLDGVRGDEWIVLDGMHPTHARVQSRLPQARAVAMLRGEGDSERPIELRADTLVIDADDLLVSIVWRGRFAVGSPEVLAAARVFAGVSLPGHPIEWPARATRPIPPTGQSARAPVLETQDVNLAAILGGATPFDADRKSELPSVTVAPSPAAATETGVIDLEKVFQRTVPFMAADAAHPPDVATPAPPGRRPTTMSTGTTDINLAEILKGAALFGKSPASMPVAPVQVASAPLQAAPVLAPPPVAPLPVTPVPAPLPITPMSGPEIRAVVLERIREKKRIDKLSLRGADLHDIDFEGASLRGVDLQGATLRGANLTSVDLTGARLSGADLTQADLTCASLLRVTGEGVKFAAARMEGADLRRARLPQAIFDDADMRDVTATRADLSGARFFRADLRSTSLRAAKVEGADFTQATTEGADFRDAEITDIRIDPVAARLLKLRLPRSI